MYAYNGTVFVSFNKKGAYLTLRNYSFKEQGRNQSRPRDCI